MPVYTKTTWQDGENKYSITDQAGNVIPGFEDIKLLYTGTGGTPLSQEKMGHIEQGIYDAHAAVAQEVVDRGAAINTRIPLTQKGAASGVVPLDSGILIPVEYLPVIPAAKLANTLDAIELSSVVWELLATQTFAVDTSFFDLSSIPAGYSDFRIIGHIKSFDATDRNLTLRFNGLSTTYTSRTTRDGVITTDSGSSILFTGAVPGGQIGIVDIMITNRNESRHIVKGQSRYSGTGGFCDLAGHWIGDNQITAIRLSLASFDTDSVIKLYGSKSLA